MGRLHRWPWSYNLNDREGAIHSYDERRYRIVPAHLDARSAGCGVLGVPVGERRWLSEASRGAHRHSATSSFGFVRAALRGRSGERGYSGEMGWYTLVESDPARKQPPTPACRTLPGLVQFVHCVDHALGRVSFEKQDLRDTGRVVILVLDGLRGHH